MMTSAMINMYEAKTQLSKLVERACAGEEVIIARGGKPAVRLAPVESKLRGKRPIGLDEGKVIIHDSFFDPLPDAFSGF
ncbi:MAG: prevent-host-death family protein [Rhodospirillales bacterium]|nr:prevent-host-death family protein [Rhodospirillales bacterium]